MPIDITNKEEKQIALTGAEIEETLLQAHLSKAAIANIEGLKASASEIDASLGRVVSSSLTTTQMQSILDKKGIIYFLDDEYVLTDTLLIDSYTSVVLAPNTTITHSVGKNIFRNKNTVEGDTYISLSGGTIDYNNPTLVGINFHNTHAVVFQNVNKLLIASQTGLNAQKYVYLLSDIQNGTFRDIDFNTNSDGLHFMGPVDKIFVDNIKGLCDDNMVAFTIGDYSTYELTAGNMTNIHVSNIFVEDGFECVRFVGKTGYYFDNIVVDGIYGNVKSGQKVLTAIQDGTTLDYTDIRSLTIKNIFCTAIDNIQIDLDCKAGKNITIDGIESKNLVSQMIKIGTNANIDTLTINNIVAPNDINATVIECLGKVTELTVNRAKAKFLNNTEYRYLFSTALGGDIGKLSMSKVSQTNGFHTLKINSSVPIINLDDVTVTNVGRFMDKSSTSTNNTVVKINNANISYTSRFLTTATSTDTTLKCYANNVTFANDTLSRLLTGGLGKISVTGIGYRAKDGTLMTPTDGDIFYNTEPTFGTGVGIYQRKAGAWIIV